jgi:two-component system chemotaxis sensor kinase CheA
MDPMADIKQTFFQECEEQLAELESGLLAMQEGARDSETVNAVFRAVHSIKGGAGAFGLEELVRFAHVFETALDEIRAGRLAADHDAVAILLRAADVLADLVTTARDGGCVDAARSAALAEELAALGAAGGAPAPVAEDDDFGFMPVAFAAAPAAGDACDWLITLRPHPALYAKANETALLLRELGRLGETSVTLDVDGLPPLEDLEPEGAYLAWTVRLSGGASEAAVRDVFEFVDGDCDLDIRRDGEDAVEITPDNAGPAAPEGDDIAALLARVQAEAQPASQSLAPAAPTAPSGVEPASSKAATPMSVTPVNATPSAPPTAAPHAAAGATIRVDLERLRAQPFASISNA